MWFCTIGCLLIAAASSGYAVERVEAVLARCLYDDERSCGGAGYLAEGVIGLRADGNALNEAAPLEGAMPELGASADVGPGNSYAGWGCQHEQYYTTLWCGGWVVSSV